MAPMRRSFWQPSPRDGEGRPARRGLAALRRDAGGSVTVIFLAALVPMLLAVGAATDLGSAYGARTKLNAAADSAALAGARAANDYIAANGTGTAQQATATQLAQAAAQRFMNAQVAAITMTGPPVVTVGVTIAGRQATVTTTVQGSRATSILKIAGIDSLTLYAKSTATMTPSAEQYYQILFFIDVSNSMAIGGTQADIERLKSDPNIACAFACHDVNSYSKATEPCGGAGQGGWVWQGYYYAYVPPKPQPSCDKRALAKTANIKLKIDYVNTAVNSFIAKIGDLDKASVTQGRYYVGIKTFGSSYNTLLKTANNLTVAASTAQTLDVETATPSAQNYGYTYITSQMKQLSDELVNVGDGSSATKMKTFVVFISDGVEDIPGGMGWGRKTDLDYTSVCKTLKDKGVSLFSIWASYSKIYGADGTTLENQYRTLVDPISAQLPTTMQGCASDPSQYFVASDGPGIQAAVDGTFHKISAGSKLRLTQ